MHLFMVTAIYWLGSLDYAHFVSSLQYCTRSVTSSGSRSSEFLTLVIFERFSKLRSSSLNYWKQKERKKKPISFRLNWIFSSTFAQLQVMIFEYIYIYIYIYIIFSCKHKFYSVLLGNFCLILLSLNILRVACLIVNSTTILQSK